MEIQDRLTELFAEVSGLPDDLLLEREIFLAMHEVASCPVDMPDHLARRVDEAVSKEIAAPGRPRLRKTFRRWIYLCLSPWWLCAWAFRKILLLAIRSPVWHRWRKHRCLQL